MKRFIHLLLILLLLFICFDYSQIRYSDIRSTSLLAYSYGITTDYTVQEYLLWYFPLCLLFGYLFEPYKKYIQHSNKIIRYKNRFIINRNILINTIIQALCIWLLIHLSIAFFNHSYKVNIHDMNVFINASLTLLFIIVLYLILDSTINSIMSFIICNGFILCSPYLLKSLHGIQNANYLIPLIIINIITIIIYFKLTERKDLI